MAYAQIHVQALSHHKVVALSSDAFRLWVAGLVYCQQHLTDGALPAAVLPALSLGLKRAAQLADELVRAQLWDASDRGWTVHDYLHWNDSREDITRRREKWRAKKRGTKPPPASPGEAQGGTPGIPARETRRDAVQDQDPFSTILPTAERGEGGSRPAADAASAAGAAPPASPKAHGSSNGKCPPAEALVALWNAHRGDALSQCRELSASRRRHASARLHDHPELDYWRSVVERVAASPFCRGQNDRGWRATFDWLLQPDSSARVLEGKYDYHPPVAPLSERERRREEVLRGSVSS